MEGRTASAPPARYRGRPRPRPPAAPAARGAHAPIVRPVLPPDVPQVFVPVRAPAPAGAALVYQPMLLGAAEIRFADAEGLDATEPVAICRR